MVVEMGAKGCNGPHQDTRRRTNIDIDAVPHLGRRTHVMPCTSLAVSSRSYHIAHQCSRSHAVWGLKLGLDEFKQSQSSMIYLWAHAHVAKSPTVFIDSAENCGLACLLKSVGPILSIDTVPVSKPLLIGP